MAKLDLSNYLYWGLYKTTAFNSWFWTGWYDGRLAEEFGLNLLPGGSVYVRGGHFFVDKDVFQRTADILRSIVAQPERVHRFRTRMQEVYDKALSENVPNDPQEFLTWLMRIGHEMLFFWFVGWAWSVHIDSIIQEKGAPIRILDYMRWDTPLIRQQQKLRTLKTMFESKGVNISDTSAVFAGLQKFPAIRKEFDEHLREYTWANFLMFYGEYLKAEDLVSQLQNVSPSAPTLKEAPAGYSDILGIAEDCGYINQACAEFYPMFGARVRPMIGQLAVSKGLTYMQLLELMPNELSSDSEGLLQEKARKRVGGYCCIFEKNGEVEIIDGRTDVEEIAAKYLPKADMSLTQLSGQVGNKGKATGPARIVLAAPDFAKVKPGDILIAAMTTPDYVILMQKSAAIVTDMGGMLCHAAIVSRELHKPCVIGTQVATQLFKDGDMVEVDADKGIVRKL